MRSVPFLSLLLSMTALAGVASAQNYVPAKNYNNPDVVVNMDVIGAVNSPYHPTPSMMSSRAAPVMSRPLPPLRPPTRMPQMMGSPQPMIQPPMAMASPSMPPPIMDDEMPDDLPAIIEDKSMTMPNAPPRPSAPIANFSAREMAVRAPAAPAPVAAPAPMIADVPPAPMVAPAPAPKAVIAEMPPELPAPIAAPAPAPNPARQLLASAREEAAANPEPIPEKPRDAVVFDEQPKPAEKLKPSAIGEEKAEEPMALTTPPMIKEIIPVEKPAALPEKIETAMLNPAPLDSTNATASAATLVDDFEAYRLNFGTDSAELAASEKAVLDKIATKLKAEERTRLQLRAYANGTPDTASVARRLSLSRAMAVRSYLTEKGLAASRLDVRALGMGSAAMGDAVGRSDIPADRVDVIFVR